MTANAEVSNEEVREIWDRKAAFWDDYIKEGNRHSKELVWAGAGTSARAEAGRVGPGGSVRQRQLCSADGERGREGGRFGLLGGLHRSGQGSDSRRRRPDRLPGAGRHRLGPAPGSRRGTIRRGRVHDGAVRHGGDRASGGVLGQAVEAARSVRVLDHPPLFRIAQVAKVAETHESSRGGALTTYSVKVTAYATPFVAKGTACGVSRRPTGTSTDR